MKRYSDLVKKELKINKKKTILSSIGMLIGIILLTFVIVLFRFNNTMLTNSSKIESGEYSVSYEMGSNYGEKINNLNSNALVGSYGTSQVIGNTKVDKDGNEINISLLGLDKNASDEMFKEGFKYANVENFPKNDNEIIVPILAEGLGFKKGDYIKVDNKDYQIIGFYKSKANDQKGFLQAITLSNQINYNLPVKVYVDIKGEGNQITRNIEQLTKVLGYTKTSPKVGINFSFLENEHGITFGNENSIFGMSISEFMIIVMVMLVSIVINFGFINFTLSSKVKQFGILRCIGATPKQIRNIVYKEVGILSVIIVIPGILIGYGSVILLANVLQSKFSLDTYGTSVGFYVIPTLIIALTSLFSIFIGALKPAIKASRVSPMEGIMGTRNNDKNIKLIKSTFIRKYLGVEAELAYRNLRAKSTIFWTSTILLLISFITFVSLTVYSISTIKMISSQYKLSKDIELELITEVKDGESIKDSYNKVFENTKAIEKYLETRGTKSEVANYMSLRNPISMFIDTDKALNSNLVNNPDFNSGFLKEIKYNNGNREVNSLGQIFVYNDEAFNLIKSNINGDKSLDTFNKDGVIIIDSNRILLDEKTGKEKKSISPVFEDIKAGEKIDVTFAPENSEVDVYADTITQEQAEKIKGNNKKIQMEVMGTISPENILKNLSNYNDTLSIIISEDFFKNHIDLFTSAGAYDSEGMMDSKVLFDFKTPQDRIDNISVIESELGAQYKTYIMDNAGEMLEIRNILTLITVGTYTFLAIIMIVLITSVIISKNLSADVRKKEFGTLLALGMNKKGLRKSIIFEALLQFVIIIVGGIPISLIICFILEKIPGSVGVSPIITIGLIFVATIIIFIITLMTSIIPFNKFKNLSMAEMMREEE